MKRIVTGLKPTGELTLGNYIGVIQNIVNLQDEFEIFLFIADLHAITTRQDRLNLRKLIKEFTLLYLSCGIDPNKTTIFNQSEIKEHAQLGYILQCNTYLGELNRMTQYKKQSEIGNDNLSAGFYTYPSLMSADILLYDADYVYVGNDQIQHLELTRTLANRFNNYYGETFKVPEAKQNDVAARVMDLQDPTKKMSKSSNNKGCILLLDDLAIVRKKIKSAVTDNEAKIYYDPTNKPGISNMLAIYSALTDLSIEEIVAKYASETSYKIFKEDLAEVVVNKLTPIQEKFYELQNSNILTTVFDNGYEKAKKIATKKIIKVEHKVGLNRKK